MQHEVLIELIFETKRFSSLIKKKIVVQTEPFKMGLKITNRGTHPIKGFTVKEISFRSAGGQQVRHEIQESFHVDTLNPKTTTEFWVDSFGTYMHGLAQVDLKLAPDIAGDKIWTCQKDHFTKVITKAWEGRWEDFLYVESRHDKIQSDSNLLMLVLTSLAAYLSFISLFLFYKYQVQPEIEEQSRNKYEAKIYCTDNPEGTWPKATGGFFSCAEVLEMMSEE